MLCASSSQASSPCAQWMMHLDRRAATCVLHFDTGPCCGKKHLCMTQVCLQQETQHFLMRRASLPVNGEAPDGVDEDSLLQSKWSVALSPDLHQRRQDLQTMSRWLQVLACVQSAVLVCTHAHALDHAIGHEGRHPVAERDAPQVEVDRYNKMFARRDPGMPEADFLVVAAQHADKLYSRAFAELNRLVRCKGVPLKTRISGL